MEKLFNKVYIVLRGWLWRLGRKIYCLARGERSNAPRENGEYNLLRTVISDIDRGGVFFDVGASVGLWSEKVLSLDPFADKIKCIHAFEPTLTSYNILLKKFSAKYLFTINNNAVSSQVATESFYINKADGLELNSLYRSGDDQEQIEIATMSLDEYTSNHNVDWIDYVKCDTEGHDFYVIQGSERLLTEGRIGIFQFEYNHRWISGRCYLKDVFDFVNNKNYWVGKITPRGFELYQYWHFELEKFYESNWILIKKDHVLIDKSVFLEFSDANVPICKKHG